MNARFKPGYEFEHTVGDSSYVRKYFIYCIVDEEEGNEHFPFYEDTDTPYAVCYPVDAKEVLANNPNAIGDDDFNEEYDMLTLDESQLYEALIAQMERASNNIYNQKIVVPTSLGNLCAIVGGDPVDFPEIFTYIEREDGVEIDLFCAGVKLDENVVRGYVYGNTAQEDYTKTYDWTESDINVEVD